MVSDGVFLTALCFENTKYIEGRFETKVCETELPVFKQTKAWLDIYFKGNNPDFKLPVKFETTYFRQCVYETVCKIGFGKTMTYGEVAYLVANQCGLKKMSAQAIGSALRNNPLLLIIPCHRVIGAKGKLIGYAGGLDKKIKLINLEKGI